MWILRGARALADGFRNYAGECAGFAETMLIDKAQLLTLSAPEMTVLVGGMRVLGTNAGNCHGVFTAALVPSPTTSSSTCSTWARVEPAAGSQGVYEGRDRQSGKVKWTGTRVDLVFGSNPSCAPWRGLRQCGCQGEVREGLRGGLDQGDESGSLRPRLRLKRLDHQARYHYRAFLSMLKGSPIPPLSAAIDQPAREMANAPSPGKPEIPQQGLTRSPSWAQPHFNEDMIAVP
jgi:hypothetical protein